MCVVRLDFSSLLNGKCVAYFRYHRCFISFDLCLFWTKRTVRIQTGFVSISTLQVTSTYLLYAIVVRYCCRCCGCFNGSGMPMLLFSFLLMFLLILFPIVDFPTSGDLANASSSCIFNRLEYLLGKKLRTKLCEQLQPLF